MGASMGFQIGLVGYLVVFTVLGLAMYRLVKGSGKQYIIAGKSLPFILAGSALLAQSLDANATMGNAGLTFEFGFWAGFVLPLGLGSCLFVTGIWFAKPLNRMNLITLPDFYYRRYNNVTEVLVGAAMSFSFMILLAGNISGGAWIMSRVFGWGYYESLIVIVVIVFIYTLAGGLWSVVATDLVQSYPAVLAFIIGAFWLLGTHGWEFFSSAMPEGFLDMSGLTDPAAGAYINWAAFLALALGDVVALDFMERVFAAKDPDTAQKACFYGGALTIVTGIAASFMGLMAIALIGEVTDGRMVLSTLATDHLPFILGLMILGGIVGAGLSTADGGLLGVSSVLGRNILQRNILKVWKADFTDASAEYKAALDKKLLVATRLSAIPVMAGAMWIAIVKPEPGVLLVLAFDVVFAGCLVPLTLGIYWKKANTPGALAAFVVGSGLRLILYFTIPEDLAGIDTMIAPVVSLLVMIPVSLMTQESHPPKHHVLDYVPTDEEVLSTKY